MHLPIDALFAGRARPMPGDGRATGIFKQPLAGAVAIGTQGLEGDEQADRRVHGGPEKAVHHFPAGHYAALAAAFPQVAAQLVAGSIGENISTRGWDERDACIGDVFAAGTARLQLAQPRAPCWKIDARYAVDGMTRFVHERGIAGWYYRVLAPGVVRAGEALILVERNADPVTLRELWEIEFGHRPPLAALLRAAASPGLSPQKQARLRQRAEWLQANP